MEYGSVRADGLGLGRPEEVWYGATPAQLARLRDWLEGEGYTTALINGLVGALVLKNLPSSPSTQSAYRRVLREFGPPNGKPKKNADNPRYVKYGQMGRDRHPPAPAPLPGGS